MRNPKADASEMPKIFTYDTTYGPDATQRGIFEVTASPIVGAWRQRRERGRGDGMWRRVCDWTM
jgi:hypothetical protein